MQPTQLSNPTLLRNVKSYAIDLHSSEVVGNRNCNDVEILVACMTAQTDL